MNDLKKMLDREAARRDDPDEVSDQRPDPILVAKRFRDPLVSMICALFGYGSARQIVAFLEGLDFSLLHADETKIKKALKGHYYRFQNPSDVAAFFITLRRLCLEADPQELFLKGYKKERSVLEGLASLIFALRQLNDYSSQGYDFLIGSPPTSKSRSPYKRWLMYLRWMVREDAIDMGLWKGVSKRDLLIPLDTHTFRVSRRLGLLRRKTYDLKAVVALTESLRRFDPEDPVRYDFALYRLGQEKIV